MQWSRRSISWTSFSSPWVRGRDSNRNVDLAVGRPIVAAHTGRGYRAESRTFDHGSHAHGAAFRAGRVLRCAQAQPSRVMARGERGKPARRTGTLGFRDKRCKLRGGAGEEDRPEANQIRREVAEAVEQIVGEPRVSRLSALNGGAGEVFVQ